MSDLFYALFFIGLGIFMIYMSIQAWTGSFKRWYVSQRDHSRMYVGMPFGLVFCGFGLIIIANILFSGLGVADFIIVYLVSPIIWLSLLLAIFQPKWIRPPWVRWLEDNYWDRLPLLIADGKQDVWAWQRRVSTQEAWRRGQGKWRVNRSIGHDGGFGRAG